MLVEYVGWVGVCYGEATCMSLEVVWPQVVVQRKEVVFWSDVSCSPHSEDC